MDEAQASGLATYQHLHNHESLDRLSWSRKAFIAIITSYRKHFNYLYLPGNLTLVQARKCSEWYIMRGMKDGNLDPENILAISVYIITVLKYMRRDLFPSDQMFLSV